jgi:chemotaxis protein CheX
MRDVDIAKHFMSAATAVTYTMANLVVNPGKFFIKHDRKALGEITAVMHVTGQRAGTIAVSFSHAGATELVRGMLGTTASTERDMQDAVGEATNMISGQARAAMAEAGVVLRTTTPTVTTGSNFEIGYAAQAPIVVIPFTTRAGTTFVVEFCLSEE